MTAISKCNEFFSHYIDKAETTLNTTAQSIRPYAHQCSIIGLTALALYTAWSAPFTFAIGFGAGAIYASDKFPCIKRSSNLFNKFLRDIANPPQTDTAENRLVVVKAALAGSLVYMFPSLLIPMTRFSLGCGTGYLMFDSLQAPSTEGKK